MIDRATIANPRTHYGNAKKATKGFIWQRATGAANIVFTLFLVWLVLSLVGAEDAAARIALVRHPVVGVVLALLFVSATIHMRIGMHDVIEDYIDKGPANTLANTVNTVVALGVAVVAIMAIAKLVFWG